MPREASPPAQPPVASRQDEAVTDVLPRSLLEEAGPFDTAVYPAGVPLGGLVVVHGTDVRTVAPTQGLLRVGRGRHNDLVLDRPGIARDHLVIEAREAAWWVVPGAGATRIDGVPLDVPKAIAGGETLELGRGVRVRLSVEPA